MTNFSVDVKAFIKVVVDADDRAHAREIALAFVESLAPTPDYICGYNSVQSGGTIEADQTGGFEDMSARYIDGVTDDEVDDDEPEGMPIDEVAFLPEGALLTMLVETTGVGNDGIERTYPAGTTAQVSTATRLPDPQGYAITLIIGPTDGDEAIVNVFDESDTPAFPFTSQGCTA